MALIYADRVKETTATTGTGTLTLAGAVTGFQAFGDAMSNSDTCYYVITDDTDWEVGSGTYSAGTLTRDTILDSSNSDAAVNWGVGSKTVFMTLPGSKIVDSSHTHTESQITDLKAYLTDITGESITALSDVYSLMSPTDGQVLTYDTTNGWQAENASGGASTLDELTDVDTDKSKTPADGDVLTFDGTEWNAEAASGGGAWGSITGTLSNQTDLQTELDGKAASSHTHTASDITDFDTEVSNNTDVAANTAKISYTDAAKVAGIEANADVTDATNVQAAGALMDSEVTNLADVKAFDPTDYAGASHSHTASDITDFDTEVSNNASVTANTAKVSYTDAAKVAGIESGATADQTGAEIKLAYEAEADTNAFTDADHSKLDGIEASADVTDTANVTSAGALMDSEVINLAQVKAFDSSDYATAAQGATADSALQNINSENLTDLSDVDTDKSKTPADGDVLTFDGTDWNAETPSGGGADTTYGISLSHFQVEDDGTTGQLTTGSASDLTGIWGTPSQTDATDFSWNGTTGILTVNTAGTIEFNIKVNSWNNANNRHELHVQLYKNGSTVLVEDSNYASRNNNQDEGGAYIFGFKDTAAATDTYRVRVFDVGVASTIGAANVAGQTYISATLYKSDSPGSWTSYSPTWAGNSTNPAIGNGSIDANYSVIGDTCKVRLVVTMGSTTTYGSGFWTFTLPQTAAGTAYQYGYGVFYCNDGTSGSTQTIATAYPLTTSTMVFDVASGSRANVDFNSPHTWASGDRLIGEFEYKLA